MTERIFRVEGMGSTAGTSCVRIVDLKNDTFIDVASDGKRAYVANSGSADVSVIDTATHQNEE